MGPDPAVELDWSLGSLSCAPRRLGHRASYRAHARRARPHGHVRRSRRVTCRPLLAGDRGRVAGALVHGSGRCGVQFARLGHGPRGLDPTEPQRAAADAGAAGRTHLAGAPGLAHRSPDLLAQSARCAGRRAARLRRAPRARPGRRVPPTRRRRPDLLRRTEPDRRGANLRAAAARLPHVGRDPRGHAPRPVLVGAVAAWGAHRDGRRLPAHGVARAQGDRRAAREGVRAAAARGTGRRSRWHPAVAHARAAAAVRAHAGDDVAAGGPRLLCDEPGRRRRRR